ncbi:MAG: redox-regulated ATPase YchF [Thermocladium sp.]|jgi:ribosome-binding ATPase YchF (GTP1/OBG family)
MVTQSLPQVGVVGKPNVGKSTFFAAATMIDVKIAPYPFTTVEPNIGVGHVRIRCVCTELGVKDNPRNSICIEGNRLIPIELIDVAGLVPGAWQGRGLGNQFLDHLRRASALIHVVDASGGTDEEGRITRPGSRDPMLDVEFLENEVTMWIVQIMRKDWDKMARLVDYAKKPLIGVLYDHLSGLGISEAMISATLVELSLDKKPLHSWSEDDLKQFIELLRRRSKPIVIAANKIDVPEAEDNVRRMMKELGDKVVPTSAEAELALRKAANKGLIKYVPGDPSFTVIAKDLPQPQRAALDKIADLMRRWGGTGVTQAINKTVLDVLGMVAVYPVADEKRFTDTEGRVLPDVVLVPGDYTVLDLARSIHSDVASKAMFAIDAVTGKRLGLDARVWHRAVIRIVTSK